MAQLSEPSADLVANILREVGYQHRLVGYRYRARGGATPAHLYSFEEVVHLLNDKCPRLNLAQLQHWLRSVIGDQELADQVAEAVDTGANDRDRMLSVRLLMGERLCQCKKATLGA